MPTRRRPADEGAERGRAIVGDLITEARLARVDRGLTQADVARALGVSRPQLSRMECGLDQALGIVRMSSWLAIVGLELSARAYPGGRPIRDAAHLALLERLRTSLHPSLRWRTEVPMPSAGDARAWDAVVIGRGWTIGVEAETRPTDIQAVQRRIALKVRDSGVERAILLLSRSRHNRDLLRTLDGSLRASFPGDGLRTLELLRAGVDPGANAVIIL